MADLIITEKTCSRCNNIKDVSHFYRDARRPSGRRCECKTCFNTNASPRIHNSEYAKHHHLKHKFGITLDQFNEMVATQKSKCGICERQRTLVVDHCHISGKIRGLLCNRCNTALGTLGDTAEGVQRALTYLQ